MCLWLDVVLWVHVHLSMQTNINPLPLLRYTFRVEDDSNLQIHNMIFWFVQNSSRANLVAEPLQCTTSKTCARRDFPLVNPVALAIDGTPYYVMLPTRIETKSLEYSKGSDQNWKPLYQIQKPKTECWNREKWTRGYSQKNWVGVCVPFPKTLTLFMTKICNIP